MEPDDFDPGEKFVFHFSPGPPGVAIFIDSFSFKGRKGK
jgi:hypothetical protein